MWSQKVYEGLTEFPSVALEVSYPCRAAYLHYISYAIAPKRIVSHCTCDAQQEDDWSYGVFILC